MLFCPTCGTKCEDGARFCGNCGTNLEGIAGVPETMMPREGGGTDSSSTDSGGAAGSAEEPWKSGNTVSDTQYTPEFRPWENQSAAVQAETEQAAPGKEEPEQTNSVQGENSSAPLRPSQMKKMKEQQRTDQQTAGGSSITIKKPEINVQKYKIMAFAISAVYTGFAGAMYAHFVGFISPETFTSAQSVMFMTMLLFGGMGSFSGPLIGAAIVTFLNETLQVLGSYRMMVYGAFILAVLLFLPHGISGLIDIVKQSLFKNRGKEDRHADA